VEALISDAGVRGARTLTGGRRHALGGTFYEPTVIVDVSPQAEIFSEKIFGPVAPVFKFETEEEAIRLANDSTFGLAAYFYGRDISQVWRVAEGLEYGMVGINEGLISIEVAPVGGKKESGNAAKDPSTVSRTILKSSISAWGSSPLQHPILAAHRFEECRSMCAGERAREEVAIESCLAKDSTAYSPRRETNVLDLSDCASERPERRPFDAACRMSVPFQTLCRGSRPVRQRLLLCRRGFCKRRVRTEWTVRPKWTVPESDLTC